MGMVDFNSENHRACRYCYFYSEEKI